MRDIDILRAAHDLIQQDQYSDAMPLCEEVLSRNPNSGPALNMMGYIALMQGADTVAYQYLKRAVVEENRAPVWANFSIAAQHCHQWNEAVEASMKAIALDKSYPLGYTNLGSALVGMSRWDEAQKAAELGLELNPEDKASIGNVAHCLLAKHQWKEGWKQWEHSLGGKSRKEWVYGNEPRWDGTKGKTVVVYGEQGLGDEIFYASCVPDACKDANVILDCDPRLEGLFKRSFPWAQVYGTRRDKSPAWLAESQIDARCSIGSLPMFYRNSDEDFPGKPYLKADPEKVLMWKALWQSKGKKVVGICSRGGYKYTHANLRDLPIEVFSDLFSKDYEFVSLDYKGGIEHPNLRQYPSVTQSKDYDDTAALIASLDLVVGVNTTAIHCANGLGVPTKVLVPEYHQWRYAGEKYVWSRTCELFHKPDWKDAMK